ncbi:MAG: hypothetical protein ACOVSV_04375, partial [Fimbriimonadaceae bacterium]
RAWGVITRAFRPSTTRHRTVGAPWAEPNTGASWAPSAGSARGLANSSSMAVTTAVLESLREGRRAWGCVIGRRDWETASSEDRVDYGPCRVTVSAVHRASRRIERRLRR